LVICSDGFAFNDLKDIPDDKVLAIADAWRAT
jgi:pyoverdine/dityrosine biosynthesis protein Dit1